MFTLNYFRLSGVNYQIYVTFCVSLNMVSIGLFSSWISLTVHSVNDSEDPESDSTMKMNLIASLPYLGGVLPIIFVSYVMSKMGRKLIILITSVVQSVVWVLLVFSYNNVCMNIGLFLRGVPNLVFVTVGAIYIAEITQPNIRGAAMGSLNLLRCVGMWFSFILVMFMSEKVVAIIGGAVSLIAFLLFLAAPESPYYFILQNNETKARKALVSLRGKQDVENELQDIKISAEEADARSPSLRQLFRNKAAVKAILLSATVVSIQCFCGAEMMDTFIVVIFSSTNLFMSIKASSLIYVSLKMIACGLGLVLVDRIGRRPLAIFSTYIIAFMLFAVGLYFYLQDELHLNTDSYSWILSLILGIYVVSYNIGMGTLIIPLATELLPTRFRAIGSVIILFLGILDQVFLVNLFTIMKESYGVYLIFWILMFCTLLGGVFCLVYVFETKGKSLKDIQVRFKLHQ